MLESPYAKGHDNPAVASIINLLEAWHNELDNGDVTKYLPDPEYAKKWTEEHIDRIINGIDEEMDKEVKSTPGRYVEAKAGPDFKRLAYPQKLALVQQLDAIIEEHRTGLLEPFTHDPVYDYNYDYGYGEDY